jgi:hypothetical protein
MLAERIGNEHAAGKRAEPIEPGAKPHHLADDDDRGRLEPARLEIGGGARKRRLEHTLRIGGGVADDRDRLVAIPPS